MGFKAKANKEGVKTVDYFTQSQRTLGGVGGGSKVYLLEIFLD